MLNASPKINGCMSKEDKVKLDGIASGANNYTLPTASTTTLGGIKTAPYFPGDNWQISTTNDGVAYTRIYGLHPDEENSGGIGYLDIQNGNYDTRYNSKGVTVNFKSSDAKTINFPSKSGTFALTSDLPQVSKGSSYGMTEKGMIDVVYRNIQQIILLDKSGAYNISNWYKNSPEGSILDMYPYGLSGGSLNSDINNLFKKMGLAQNVPHLEEVSTLSISYSCHMRLIHINNAVLIAEYVINDY